MHPLTTGRLFLLLMPKLVIIHLHNIHFSKQRIPTLAFLFLLSVFETIQKL